MTSGTAGLPHHVDTMPVMPNRFWLLVAGYLTCTRATTAAAWARLTCGNGLRGIRERFEP